MKTNSDKNQITDANDISKKLDFSVTDHNSEGIILAFPDMTLTRLIYRHCANSLIQLKKS